MVDIPGGPRLKIERAKHHINDLQRQVDAYLAQKPLQLVVREQRDPPQRVLAVKTITPAPDELSLIIGDAVHNLRSALDLFAFGLAGHLAANPQSVHFPFAWKPENVRQAIRSRQIHLAGEHIENAIAELDFYLGGNNLLAGLHLLDITDKHELILTVGRAAQIVADDIGKNLPGIKIFGPGVIHYTGEGDDIFTADMSPAPRHIRKALRNRETEAKGNPVFVVAFGENTPFPGHGVVPALVEVTAEVERAIRHVLAAQPL